MTTLTRRFHLFAVSHDDIPAFHAVYIVGTFLAAAVLHTGFFAILIALHMCLDYVKYRDIHGFSHRMTFHAIAFESLADIALLLLSLTFGVYLSPTYALAAVSGLLRSELTILRAIGTVLPRVRIVEHMLTVFLGFHSYMHTVQPGIDQPLTRVKRASLWCIGICAFLLILAPIVYGGDMKALLFALARELQISL